MMRRALLVGGAFSVTAGYLYFRYKEYQEMRRKWQQMRAAKGRQYRRIAAGFLVAAASLGAYLKYRQLRHK